MRLFVLGVVSLALFFVAYFHLSRLGLSLEILLWIVIPFFLSWMANMFFGMVIGVEYRPGFSSIEEAKRE